MYFTIADCYIIPNAIKRINHDSFYNGFKLVRVTLGNGLEVIEYGVFERCSLQQSMVIHDAIKGIKDGAFKNCQGLALLGDGLEEIGEEAFEECTSFECIIIPNAVKTIKNGVLKNCYGLTTVTLGNGLVEDIGEKAFEWCELLERIIISNVVKIIKERAIFWFWVDGCNT